MAGRQRIRVPVKKPSRPRALDLAGAATPAEEARCGVWRALREVEGLLQEMDETIDHDRAP